MTTPAQRLAALRAAMKQHQLDAWIIPSADPHLSEYLPEHWQTRSWVSGFTGSVGTLAVTENEATLWADSRYWEQAEKQLAGSGIRLEKLGFGRTHIDWLAEVLPANAVVGIAPDMLSAAGLKQLQAAFAAKNITLRLEDDIVNGFWNERPALPDAPVFIHEAVYTEESAAEKLARVRQFMRDKGADHHLVSSLDDIAWITNLRGGDVDYNPVFLSHLLIDAERAVLFIDSAKLGAAEQAWLQEAGIATAPYADAADAVSALSGCLMYDSGKVAVSVVGRLPESVRLIDHINPSTLFKSVKSDKEVEYIRQAMIQDGAALCGFFAEFERRIATGDKLTELDVSDMLIEHRSRREAYVSPSFGTIAGYRENGALPHYSATPEAFSPLDGSGLLLIDSGAQYKTGTTDITRVVSVGEPTAEQKRDFTLVLKAHIALACAVFPEDIKAPMLDAICRAPLWQAQCDYGHGTGHGVGYFLNVHEGPQLIAYQASVLSPHHAMKAGMITSNEPGLYRPGKWGIRIESLVVSRPVAQPAETEFGRFLYFETVTMCPIDTRLVEKSLLNDAETAWLNQYHATVRAKLEPLTEGEAKTWLLERTQAI